MSDPVTEKLITEQFGYTSSQIKRRRQNHWIEGVHWYKDAANATLYDREEIRRWMESTKIEADAELSGMKMAQEGRSRFKSHTAQLV
jgi:hypothetical protein|tara:strand:+ start:396 stop:656 length:261 start_codon:yes stop_codon:yes gene_type:complete